LTCSWRTSREEIEKIKRATKHKGISVTARTSPINSPARRNKNEIMTSSSHVDNKTVLNINEKKIKNFDSAYKAITNKLIKNSMKNPKMRPAVLLTDREIKKHKKELEFKQQYSNNNVHQRLYVSCTRKIRSDVEKQEKEKTDRDKNEESFMPKTNKSKFDSKRRSVNDFLIDMSNFSTRKNMKINEGARIKIITEGKVNNSFFNKKGVRSRSPNYSMIKNLYDKGVKKQIQRSVSPDSLLLIDRNVAPKINKISRMLNRDKNVSEILYDDANTRRVKMNERRKSNYSTLNNSPAFNEKKNTSYMVSKVSKELENIWVYNNIHVKDDQLNLTQLVNVMTDMWYISSPITQNEQLLVSQAWGFLRGEELNGISVRNLLFFLIGIHKLKIGQIFIKSKNNIVDKTKDTSIGNTNQDIDFLESNNSSIRVPRRESIDINTSINEISYSWYVNYSEIGCFDKHNKFFFKDEEDQNKAYQIFSELIQRKASKAKCAYYIGANAGPVDRRFSYTPHINEKANQFDVANKHSSKNDPMTMKSTNMTFLHSEQLLQKGKEYKDKIEIKRSQIRNEEMREWTFTPVLNNPAAGSVKAKNRYDVILTSDDEPIRKNMAMAIDKNMAMAMDKNKNDMVITPDMLTHTFKRHFKETFDNSTLSGGYADDQGDGKRAHTPNLDVYLLHNTRPSKSTEEVISASSDSPEKPVSVSSKKNPTLHKEEAPILFLDINFGNNKMTRIVMYKGKHVTLNI
jgi:hypothetical protein